MRYLCKHILINVLFLFCVFNISIIAQNDIKQFDKLSGLPSNTIFCFYKDAKGIMWLGTDVGLCSYDGVRFKVYNQKNGLKHLEIWSIVEDENHHLWLSTYPNGIARFDGNKFEHYKSKLPEWEYNGVRKIVYEPKLKCLILATEYGLALFKNNKFYYINKDKDFQSIGIDHYKNEWLITSSFKGVYKLKFKKDLSKSRLDSLFYIQTTFSSFINGDSYYCSGPDNRLFSKNFKTNSLKNWKLPIVWNYATDKTNLYLATWNISDPTGGLYTLNKQHKLYKTTEISSNQIWSMFYDQKDCKMWIGSMDKGFYVLDLSSKKQILNKVDFNISDFEGQTIFIDDEENVWIGAKDKLIIHSKRGHQVLLKNDLINKINNYLSVNKCSNLVNKIPTQKIINGFTVNAIHTDNEKNIWVNSTWGLIGFDTNFKVIAFKYTNNGSHSFVTQKGEVYLSKIFGTTEFYKNREALISNYTKEFKLKDKNSPRDIVKIASSAQSFWLASSYFGLYKFEDNKFYSLLSSKIFNEPYLKDIRSVDHKLVITTTSGDVYCVNTEKNKFQIVNKFNLGNEIIGSNVDFAIPYKSFLFIGTNKGLNIIRNKRRIKLLDKESGILNLNFKDAFIKDDFLWILTESGVQQLEIKDLINYKPSEKELFIKAIIVNGKKIKERSNLILDYNQNSIQFDIKSIDLYYGKKNSYLYKIDGGSSNWFKYNEFETFQLNGLSPGKYNLIVKGENLVTGNYFKPFKISIEIKPPFWKTIWFFILMLSFIFITTYYFINQRIKRIRNFEKEKSALNNQLNETKIEALRSQMNPHFIFNAMNSIQNFIIDNDTKNAMFYLSEFSRLIRHTLENVSEKFTSIESELKFLNHYLTVQKMRFNNISTKLSVSKDIDKYNELIPSLIIQPFIENAFEHAFDDSIKNQQIEIQFYIDSNLLCCKITDNGIGLFTTNNKHHKSLGTEIVSKRLMLLNDEMSTKDFDFSILNSSVGTTVLVTFKRIFLNENLVF